MPVQRLGEGAVGQALRSSRRPAGSVTITVLRVTMAWLWALTSRHGRFEIMM
jgi:hypothetical protein